MKKLTEKELALVKSLLNLYDAVWDKGVCKLDCDCNRCEAMREAGDHQATTFATLGKKSGYE